MEELRNLRKQIGLTQVEAASLLGVSRRTYQTYEETDKSTAIAEELYNRLNKLGIIDGSNVVLNVRIIKQKCSEIFKKYPEVKCAYLYGSYARQQANKDSDIDILIVNDAMGIEYFDMAHYLEEALHKSVDLQTSRQMEGSVDFINIILTEGIKIYSI